MEAIEYCEMKHGYCACAKTGEVVCAKILREVEDDLHIQRARNERDAAERKRRSRYVEDEPIRRGGLMLREHQAAMLAAMSKMIIPSHRMGKTRIYEEMYRGVEPISVEVKDYAMADAAVDWSKIEARMMEHIREPLISPRERRLGSSDKPYTKFLDDPMKVRKK